MLEDPHDDLEKNPHNQILEDPYKDLEKIYAQLFLKTLHSFYNLQNPFDSPFNTYVNIKYKFIWYMFKDNVKE